MSNILLHFFGGGIDQFLRLSGIPVFQHTLVFFPRCAFVTLVNRNRNHGIMACALNRHHCTRVAVAGS